ncbi:MAG TPA: hypothetical protein VFD58_31390 [Blastocatellia bacterium]|nr:hypothetical protein [Blastocatellia bacterium]
MFMKIRRSHFVMGFIGLALVSTFASAQETKSSQSPSVTAAATTGRVRFAAPGEVTQLRLEVFAPGGEKLFDSDFQPGTLLDWSLLDQQGQRLADGEYLCLVTARALSGQFRLRHGLLRLESGETALRSVETGQLSSAHAAALAGSQQAFAAGSVERSTPFRILNEGEALTTTVMAHDGGAGQLSGSAAGLSIRAGDFFGRQGEVQLLLTPEGNLGVGVARPEARLDVAGLIRTSKGIVFPDGTIQTTAANLVSSAGRDRLSALDNPTGSAIRDRLSPGRTVQAESEQKGRAAKEILGPNQVNISGAGTTNRITKWTDGPNGVVGDSTISEVSGDIGIGTSSPGGVFDLQRNSAGDILQRLWNTGSGGAKLRYVAATGQTSQLQLTDGIEWLMAIAGNNQIGMQFRVRDTTDPNSEAALAGAAKMTIRRSGNVGIGTTSPPYKLSVIESGNHALYAKSDFIGVWGDSTTSNGVYGSSVSSAGVYGRTLSTIFNTAGVLGEASASSGNVVGVYGKALNDSLGTGVAGFGKATGGYFSAVSGTGAYGVTASATFNAAGLLGEASASSGQVVGVYGKALGSPNGTGVQGVGLAGGGYFSATGNAGTGVGVYGTGDKAGVSGQSTTGTGVTGTTDATSFNAAGVLGEATAGSGTVVGVFGKATNDPNGTGVAGVGGATGGYFQAASSGGRAISLVGNAVQDRGSGGVVKAMAYIDPFAPAGQQIVRCYNSQATGSNVSTPPCGFGIGFSATPGNYGINFGFKVDDRFISITPFITGGRIVANVLNFQGGGNEVVVVMGYSDDRHAAGDTHAKFYIIVY